MEANYRQIFQTSNPGRWNRVKWSLRVIMAVALFFLVVFFIALVNATNPSLPRLRDKNEVYKKILNPNDPTTFITRKNLRFQSFQQFIQHHRLQKPASFNRKHKLAIASSQIRSAFTCHGMHNLFSLKSNAGKLNMIFPEWIFLTPGIRCKAASIRQH